MFDAVQLLSQSPVFFITGIDTDVGKTYATGFLAKRLLDAGRKVITQKLVQTGQSAGISEDILEHRRLMKLPILPVDENTLTCPYRFAYPASPALAARLENQTIEPERITSATRQLLTRYEIVLLEGAGGLLVPLTDTLTTADYIETQRYPIVLVTSAKLGSVNHTLLTLEALERRDIPLACLVFNNYPRVDETLHRDTLDIFKQRCKNVIEL